MTAHHLSGNAPLPKQALYRAVYANQNYELNFGDENADSWMGERLVDMFICYMMAVISTCPN